MGAHSSAKSFRFMVFGLMLGASAACSGPTPGAPAGASDVPDAALEAPTIDAQAMDAPPAEVSDATEPGDAGPFRYVEVGRPGRPGALTVANDTYTITASGADIWTGSDSFGFAARPFSGDGE